MTTEELLLLMLSVFAGIGFVALLLCLLPPINNGRDKENGKGEDQ